jgi:pimeloyl-ACP methyl ester carboxylesterase
LDRRPLLLLPGTLCTGAVFDLQRQRLSHAADALVIAEFRGERSIAQMADTAARLVPTGRKADVVGFSMGGMVAIDLATRFPDRVNRIALLNSNSHSDLPGRHAARVEALDAARRQGLRAVVEKRMLPAYLHRQEAAHRDLILDMAEEQGMEAFAAQIEALSTRPDAGRALAGLELPVLILGAVEDPLCPPASQRDMLRHARRGELVLLEDCGHFALLEKPDEVNRALLDWLGRED